MTATRQRKGKVGQFRRELAECMETKMIEINKEIIFQELIKRIEIIFSLPETCTVTIRDIVIQKTHSREYMYKLIKNAVEISYHDAVSDIDMAVAVRLSPNDLMNPELYIKRIDRYGFTEDNYLGLVLINENKMYRIVLQNGMRYDFGFNFVYDKNADSIQVPTETPFDNDNLNWPMNNIDRFWFQQIQALGKLYRKDFLISDHLANMNINETLVQQMVLRDIKYETHFHRYGYQEKLEYLQIDKVKCPYQREDLTFNIIAAKIFAASIAYDKLVLQFYPQYQERKNLLFAIWDCYHIALST